MMAWLGAIVLAVGFITIVHYLQLVAKTKTVSQIATQAMQTIGDKSLSDEVKEKQLQKHSLTLMGLFLILLAGGIAAIGVPSALVWGMEQAGWLKLSDVMATTISWQFLLLTTLIGIVVTVVWRKMKNDV